MVRHGLAWLLMDCWQQPTLGVPIFCYLFPFGAVISLQNATHENQQRLHLGTL